MFDFASKILWKALLCNINTSELALSLIRYAHKQGKQIDFFFFFDKKENKLSAHRSVGF